jgi:hypothetical protein
MGSIKNNTCGKGTRQFVSGSIEVYSIHNYGAAETEYYLFLIIESWKMVIQNLINI